jgi:hypothetical protein
MFKIALYTFLTDILNERLRVFSEEVFLLEENQFGFKKSYSTTDSILTLFSFFIILKGLPLFLYIGLILPISQISGEKPVSKI